MAQERRSSAAGHDGGGEHRDAVTARLLVSAQVVLLGLIALLPTGHDWPVPRGLVALGLAGAAAGLAVMILGATTLGRGLTALPLPNRQAQLRTGGLYRYVRHPIYTGLLLAAASVTAISGSGARAVALVLLVVLLTIKARWEEVRLERRFEGYADYAARTARFVPRPRRRTRGPRR